MTDKKKYRIVSLSGPIDDKLELNSLPATQDITACFGYYLNDVLNKTICIVTQYQWNRIRKIYIVITYYNKVRKYKKVYDTFSGELSTHNYLNDNYQAYISSGKFTHINALIQKFATSNRLIYDQEFDSQGRLVSSIYTPLCGDKEYSIFKYIKDEDHEKKYKYITGYDRYGKRFKDSGYIDNDLVYQKYYEIQICTPYLDELPSPEEDQFKRVFSLS